MRSDDDIKVLDESIKQAQSVVDLMSCGLQLSNSYASPVICQLCQDNEVVSIDGCHKDLICSTCFARMIESRRIHHHLQESVAISCPFCRGVISRPITELEIEKVTPSAEEGNHVINDDDECICTICGYSSQSEGTNYHFMCLQSLEYDLT